MRPFIPALLVSVTVLAACGGSAPVENGAQQDAGMAALAPLAGEWCVTGTIIGLDGAESSVTGRATVELVTRGAAQLERLVLEIRGESVEGLTVRTWDPQRARFRFGVVRGASGQLVVLEGERVDGTWQLDTLGFDDALRTGARTIHSRELLSIDGAERFSREFFGSADVGGTWAASGRLDYQRPQANGCKAQAAEVEADSGSGDASPR